MGSVGRWVLGLGLLALACASGVGADNAAADGGAADGGGGASGSGGGSLGGMAGGGEAGTGDAGGAGGDASSAGGSSGAAGAAGAGNAVGSGGGAGASGAAGAAGATGDPPIFGGIVCLPDVGSGAVAVEGQPVSCTFGVTGEPGVDVLLSCEDIGGTPLDCSTAPSGFEILPLGPVPLPVTGGRFQATTAGRAGTTLVVFWVANDGSQIGRHTYAAQVVADDGVNGAPTLSVDCGGDADGEVDVPAGQPLECRVTVLDPDPDVVSWSFVRTSSVPPVTEPTPPGDAQAAPFAADWVFSTDAAEAGGTWVFRFTADDSVAPPVVFDLTVNVN